MWIVFEECGVACATVTYFVVVFVYFGFVRVGIWEEALAGEWQALIHFVVFQYHCFMIFLSHFKCMTTEPGLIPKETEELEFDKLPERTQKIIKQIGLKMRDFEVKMRADYKIENELKKFLKEEEGFTP